MKLLVVALFLSLFENVYCNNGLIFCIPKVGSNGDEFLKVMSLQIPETRTEQCLKACVMKAMQTMTDANKLNTQGTGPYLQALQKTQPEIFNQIMQIFNECQIDDPSTDECTAAYNLSKCINPKLLEIIP
ncbi:Odorant-binding protein 19d [Carabus blaptoides fortunei]